LIAAVLLSGSGGATRASAATPPSTPASDVRERVMALLDASQGYPREETWRPLGSDAVPVLTSLVADRAAPTARRSQAMVSLALVDPAGGAGSIRQVLEDPRAPAEVRASAAVALGRAMGPDAIPTLLTRLEDREAPVREAVAVALGRLGGQQVRQALEDRLPLEEQPLVREALQRGLSLLEP
jgi:HEAT repeat protein